MTILPTDNPLATAAVNAIQSGDVDGLAQLLARNPSLVSAGIAADPEGITPTGTRTLLHVATDWPGHFPNVAAVIATLAAAGADVDARFVGRHRETPLHWAASCDDVEALDALLDAGADIEADGAVIGDGTALADASAFGQWRAAHRLLERGARANFWESAVLGLLDHVHAHLAADPPPSADELTGALWGACHDNQQAAAAILLDRGADLNWVGWDGLTPLDAAVRAGAAELIDWLRQHGARTAFETAPSES